MAVRNFPIQDDWRSKDYSGIEESFSESKTLWFQKGTQGGGIGALVLYTILALPVFLLIFLMIAGKKSNIARGILYVSYGLMISGGLFTATNSIYGIGFIAYVVILALISELYFHKSQLSVVTVTSDSIVSTIPPYISENKVFGIAGDLSSARGKFSDKNIELGEEGEVRTAAMLNELLVIPGTRIFHGVRWPGSDNADIDHIAINGRKIALIDSKMWSGNTHTITSNGAVSSSQYGGEKPVIRDLMLPKAIVSMTRHNQRRGVKKADMHGWLAIHKLNKKSVKVNNKYNPGLPVTLGDAKDVIDSLGTWFSDEKKLDGSIHQDVVDSIFSTMK